MISIKSQHEIELMRAAGRALHQILVKLDEVIKPGISTKDIDHIVEEMCKKNDMRPAEKGYCGFPASACTSINEEIVHGIPNKKRILREGDIVSVDIVVDNKGYMADACRTFAVGNISDDAKRLVNTAERAFFEGLRYCKKGNRLMDVAGAIQRTVEGEGFNVIRDFVGHGIGKEMHEDPKVFNYVPGREERAKNPRLLPGMTLAIEPMICQGDFEVDMLPDNWTAVTVDGGLSAHYENTVLITEGEPELLTLYKD